GLSQPEIAQFEKDGKLDIDVDGQLATVELADVEIISEDIPGWLVANEGNLTVALDITVTPELQREGVARELVNRIQNVRKSKDFDITDKIEVVIAPDERTDEAVAQFGDYIARQVLATNIKVAPVDSADAVELDMDGWTLPITVKKVK
ncbi:MAG: isoleucine--tRNA ligase, partial [Muribaculaceae bacterium]|nr:isoleucine--tRNA ligase [Muribaculaceae bacterium]